MNLKKKLEFLRLRNKYEAFRGVRNVTVTSLDEMTDKEREAIWLTHKMEAVSIDNIKLTASYEEYLFWIEKKIKPLVSDALDIIIVDGNGLVFLLVEDIKFFLEDFFKDRDNLSISLINRHLHKFIIIYETEYFLEFFEVNI